jgi:hypothetical protein
MKDWTFVHLYYLTFFYNNLDLDFYPVKLFRNSGFIS